MNTDQNLIADHQTKNEQIEQYADIQKTGAIQENNIKINKEEIKKENELKKNLNDENVINNNKEQELDEINNFFDDSDDSIFLNLSDGDIEWDINDKESIFNTKLLESEKNIPLLSLLPNNLDESEMKSDKGINKLDDIVNNMQNVNRKLLNSKEMNSLLLSLLKFNNSDQIMKVVSIVPVYYYDVVSNTVRIILKLINKTNNHKTFMLNNMLLLNIIHNSNISSLNKDSTLYLNYSDFMSPEFQTTYLNDNNEYLPNNYFTIFSNFNSSISTEMFLMSKSIGENAEEENNRKRCYTKIVQSILTEREDLNNKSLFYLSSDEEYNNLKDLCHIKQTNEQALYFHKDWASSRNDKDKKKLVCIDLNSPVEESDKDKDICFSTFCSSKEQQRKAITLLPNVNIQKFDGGTGNFDLYGDFIFNNDEDKRQHQTYRHISKIFNFSLYDVVENFNKFSTNTPIKVCNHVIDYYVQTTQPKEEVLTMFLNNEISKGAIKYDFVTLLRNNEENWKTTSCLNESFKMNISSLKTFQQKYSSVFMRLKNYLPEGINNWLTEHNENMNVNEIACLLREKIWEYLRKDVVDTFVPEHKQTNMNKEEQDELVAEFLFCMIRNAIKLFSVELNSATSSSTTKEELKRILGNEQVWLFINIMVMFINKNFNKKLDILDFEDSSIDWDERIEKDDKSVQQILDKINDIKNIMMENVDMLSNNKIVLSKDILENMFLYDIIKVAYKEYFLSELLKEKSDVIYKYFKNKIPFTLQQKEEVIKKIKNKNIFFENINAFTSENSLLSMFNRMVFKNWCQQQHSEQEIKLESILSLLQNENFINLFVYQDIMLFLNKLFQENNLQFTFLVDKKDSVEFKTYFSTIPTHWMTRINNSKQECLTLTMSNIMLNKPFYNIKHQVEKLLCYTINFGQLQRMMDLISSKDILNETKMRDSLKKHISLSLDNSTKMLYFKFIISKYFSAKDLDNNMLKILLGEKIYSLIKDLLVNGIKDTKNIEEQINNILASEDHKEIINDNTIIDVNKIILTEFEYNVMNIMSDEVLKKIKDYEEENKTKVMSKLLKEINMPGTNMELVNGIYNFIMEKEKTELTTNNNRAKSDYIELLFNVVSEKISRGEEPNMNCILSVISLYHRPPSPVVLCTNSSDMIAFLDTAIDYLAKEYYKISTKMERKKFCNTYFNINGSSLYLPEIWDRNINDLIILDPDVFKDNKDEQTYVEDNKDEQTDVEDNKDEQTDVEDHNDEKTLDYNDEEQYNVDESKLSEKYNDEIVDTIINDITTENNIIIDGITENNVDESKLSEKYNDEIVDTIIDGITTENNIIIDGITENNVDESNSSEKTLDYNNDEDNKDESLLENNTNNDADKNNKDSNEDNEDEQTYVEDNKDEQTYVEDNKDESLLENNINSNEDNKDKPLLENNINSVEDNKDKPLLENITESISCFARSMSSMIYGVFSISNSFICSSISNIKNKINSVEDKNNIDSDSKAKKLDLQPEVWDITINDLIFISSSILINGVFLILINKDKNNINSDSKAKKLDLQPDILMNNEIN